jgi:hypothetical protein
MRSDKILDEFVNKFDFHFHLYSGINKKVNCRKRIILKCIFLPDLRPVNPQFLNLDDVEMQTL